MSDPSNIVLQTDRLYLRCFTEDDADLIYQLNKDPLVTRFVHEPVTTPELAVEVLHEIILPQYKINQYGRWAVHQRHDKQFIGWCGLKKLPGQMHPDLGYRYHVHHWGKGYATEAAVAVLMYGFNVLQLPVITAQAQADNQASIKVLLKCGMKCLGISEENGLPIAAFEKHNPGLPVF